MKKCSTCIHFEKDEDLTQNDFRSLYGDPNVCCGVGICNIDTEQWRYSGNRPACKNYVDNNIQVLCGEFTELPKCRCIGKWYKHRDKETYVYVTMIHPEDSNKQYGIIVELDDPDHSKITVHEWFDLSSYAPVDIKHESTLRMVVRRYNLISSWYRNKSFVESRKDKKKCIAEDIPAMYKVFLTTHKSSIECKVISKYQIEVLDSFSYSEGLEIPSNIDRSISLSKDERDRFLKHIYKLNPHLKPKEGDIKMSKPISFTKTEQTINKDIIPAIARVIKDVLTRVAVDDANVNEKVMFRNVNEKVMFRADCLTLMRILPRYKKLFYHLLINAPNTAQHGKPFPSLAYWHITHAATIENTLTEIVMKGSGHHEIWREGIKEIDHDFEVKFFKEHCDVMRKHSIFALDAMNCIGTYIDLKLVNGEKFKAIYKTLMKYLPEYKDVFDLLETFGLHGGLFVTSAYDIIHSPKGCEVIEMILSIALNTKQKWVKHSDGERILESFKFVRFIEHAEDTGKINPKEAAKKVMEKSKELKDDEETIKITSKENGICKDCDWKECPFVGTDLNPSICMKGSTFKEEKKEAKHACSGDCKCKTKTKDMYCCLCGCRKPTSDFIDLKFVTDVHVCKYCAQIISDNHA